MISGLNRHPFFRNDVHDLHTTTGDATGETGSRPLIVLYKLNHNEINDPGFKYLVDPSLPWVGTLFGSRTIETT